MIEPGQNHEGGYTIKIAQSHTLFTKSNLLFLNTSRKPSIDGVMVSVLASEARGPGFDPGWGRLSFSKPIANQHYVLC